METALLSLSCYFALVALTWFAMKCYEWIKFGMKVKRENGKGL